MAVGLRTDTADPGGNTPGGGRSAVFYNRADRRNDDADRRDQGRSNRSGHSGYTAGRKRSVDITVVCGNYKTVCTITVMQYEYPDPNWEIGQVLETAGSTFQKLGDSQSMRIATDYMETPVDTIITCLSGSGYYYQLYKYIDGKMAEMTQWITCSGTIEILSETYSGFALKVRKGNYGKWTEEDIAAFAKTVQIESA